MKKKAYSKFITQKRAATQRGIAWSLTYEEWRDIWANSGKYRLRGKGKGKYCMCRFGDTGPYSANNVYIDTFERNSGAVWANKGEEYRQLVSAMLTGRRLSESHKANISAGAPRGARHHNSRAVIVDGVRYESMTAARLALGISDKAVHCRIRSRHFPNYQYA